MTYDVLSWVFAGAWAIASAFVLAMLGWDEWTDWRRKRKRP